LPVIVLVPKSAVHDKTTQKKRDPIIVDDPEADAVLGEEWHNLPVPRS
jgi:hypothetical protein